jgi:hypothetical protein
LDLPPNAINEAEGTIKLAGGRTVRIASYPINIKWDDSRNLGEKAEYTFKIREKLADNLLSAGKIDASTREVLCSPKSIFVYGIERFDYTKGIQERVNAFEKYLEHLGEDKSRLDNPVVFVMTLAETRGNIAAYKNYQDSVRNKITQLNEKYREKLGYTPIIETGALTDPEIKRDWMVNADVFLMNALKDGMNLTLQEVLANTRFSLLETDKPDSITRKAQAKTPEKLNFKQVKHTPVVPIISQEAGVGTLDPIIEHCLTVSDPKDECQLSEILKKAIGRSAMLKTDSPIGNVACSDQAYKNAALQHFFRNNDVGAWAAAYLKDLRRK